jgi:hypothetical protein
MSFVPRIPKDFPMKNMEVLEKLRVLKEEMLTLNWKRNNIRKSVLDTLMVNGDLLKLTKAKKQEGMM